ncbi:MAG TPA: hypothetical protein VIR54_28970, partial [Vicinamibacterales bacterium]
CLMTLLAVLLFVLGLRDVLVALNQFCLRASPVEMQLTRALRAHSDLRQQAFKVLSLAGRAGRRVSRANQLLELVTAAAASVFVDWHGETAMARKRRSVD